MNETTTALSSSIAIAIGFVCLRTGRWPLELLSVWLVHIRAAWLLAGMMAAASWARRDRYQECLEAVRREQ